MLASAFFNGLGHDQHHCRGAHLSHCALTVLQCVKYICLDNEATFTLVGCMDMQIAAEMWRFPDRSTESGKRINMYLSKEVEMSDEEVHLLFAQNRWEKRCACVCVCVCADPSNPGFGPKSPHPCSMPLQVVPGGMGHASGIPLEPVQWWLFVSTCWLLVARPGSLQLSG